MSINLVFVFQYVLSVLKFTYPTLFQGLSKADLNCFHRSEILSWLPASVIFVGIIYAGSRALSRLPIPVFLTIHNAAEVITCGFQKFVQKELSCLCFLSLEIKAQRGRIMQTQVLIGIFWGMILDQKIGKL
uniref:Transmembrane protein 241 n=1 Tax=Pavo cristatus TaxID=9049 RepID=A0A8C9G0X5_PAVCR